MTAVEQRDPFQSLLESEARGFFFLKRLLADQTTEQKLTSIVNKAEGVYDRAVAAGSLPSFQPYFNFVREGGVIKLLISQESGGEDDSKVIGEVLLTPVICPINKHWIVALCTELPVPDKLLENLALEELKRELELYYELLDVCNGNLLCRMVKSFEEIEQGCKAVYRYDLTSTAKHIGLSVRKDEHRNFCMFIELKK